MMIDDNVIEDIASIVFRNAKKENPAIQLLKQRLSETENALNNLLRAIEEGIITPTTKQRMIELEQTRDEIKLKLIKEEMKKPTITKEGLILWLKHIQSMSLETKEHKQRLIDIFVNAVYLYDDKLVITFNYKEASKTVTLKEVNGSIIECSGAPKIRYDENRVLFFFVCILKARHRLTACGQHHFLLCKNIVTLWQIQNEAVFTQTVLCVAQTMFSCGETMLRLRRFYAILNTRR